MMSGKSSASLRPLSNQRGLTLVEVMITLALSLFIMAGISELYVESKHSFRVQGSVTALEENSRLAMDRMSYALRMLGHFAGVKPADISTAVSLSGNTHTGEVPVSGATADLCNEAYIERVTESLKGYEKKPPCIASSDWVTGSDAFVVRFADTNGILADADLPISGRKQVLIRTSVADTATMFEADDSIPSPAWENGVYNFPYQFSIFFIRPCSSMAGATCAATDDNGKPVPTLVRLTLDKLTNNITQEAMVEGIETMQLLYGRDTDDDGSVDIYQTATEIATAASGGAEMPLWNQVQTVEITLVARGDALDVKNTYTLGKYNLTSVDGSNTILENMGLDTFVSGLSAHDQKFPRSLYTTVVDLKNR